MFGKLIDLACTIIINSLAAFIGIVLVGSVIMVIIICIMDRRG